MPTTKIDALLNQISAQPSTEHIVMDTVRAITARLAAALKGQKLRGLTNLGTAAVPFYGYRLDRVEHRIPFPATGEAKGRTATVLAQDGRVLHVATVRLPATASADTAWFCFGYNPVLSIEPQELAALVRALPGILDRHLEVVAAERVAVAGAARDADRLFAGDRPQAATTRLPRRGSGIIVDE